MNFLKKVFFVLIGISHFVCMSSETTPLMQAPSPVHVSPEDMIHTIDRSESALGAVVKLKKQCSGEQALDVNQTAHLIEALNKKSENFFQSVNLLAWSKIVPKTVLSTYRSQHQSELEKAEQESHNKVQVIVSEVAAYSCEVGSDEPEQRLEKLQKLVRAGANFNKPIENVERCFGEDEISEYPIFYMIDYAKGLATILKTPFIDPNVYPYDSQSHRERPVIQAIYYANRATAELLIKDRRVKLDRYDLEKLDYYYQKMKHSAPFSDDCQGKVWSLPPIREMLVAELERRGESAVNSEVECCTIL